MVSKASDDLPEPLRPVITVKVLRGISTEMFFRLCWRAPRTVILLIAMNLGPYPWLVTSLAGAGLGIRIPPHSEGRQTKRAALLRILAVRKRWVKRGRHSQRAVHGCLMVWRPRSCRCGACL